MSTCPQLVVVFLKWSNLIERPPLAGMAGLMQGSFLNATAWTRPHSCSCQRPLVQRSSAWRPHCTGRHSFQVTAAKRDEVKESPLETEPAPPKRKKSSKKRAKPDQELKLSSFNPLTLGRQSRQIFDDVWQQFTKLSSPTRGGTDRLAQTDIGKLSAAISPGEALPHANCCPLSRSCMDKPTHVLAVWSAMADYI